MGTELLDWAESHARSSDKQTSHEGAAHAVTVLNERCAEFLAALTKIGSATAKEVANEVYPNCHSRFDSVRRRAIDLVKLGLVRECDPRPCKLSGKKATVYEVVK